MAFHVFFQLVENATLPSKATPWQCDKCRKRDKALVEITVDYDRVVICKKCFLEAKKMITDREKEIRDENRIKRNK